MSREIVVRLTVEQAEALESAASYVTLPGCEWNDPSNNEAPSPERTAAKRRAATVERARARLLEALRR